MRELLQNRTFMDVLLDEFDRRLQAMRRPRGESRSDGELQGRGWMDLAWPVGEAIRIDTYYLGVRTFLYDEGDYARSVRGILQAWWEGEEAVLSPRARRIVRRLLLALLGLNGHWTERTLAEQVPDSEEASADAQGSSMDEDAASSVTSTAAGEGTTPSEAASASTTLELSQPHLWPGRRYIDQVSRGI